jgi:hypothetical protein
LSGKSSLNIKQVSSDVNSVSSKDKIGCGDDFKKVLSPQQGRYDIHQPSIS